MKSVPPHMLGVALGTVTPDGRVSLKPTPVSDVFALGLVIVNISVEVRLSAIVDGLNDEVVVGGEGAVTVSDAVVLLPLPPSFELTWLVVLVLMPDVVPVTVVLT